MDGVQEPMDDEWWRKKAHRQEDTHRTRTREGSLIPQRDMTHTWKINYWAYANKWKSHTEEK